MNPMKRKKIRTDIKEKRREKMKTRENIVKERELKLT